MEKKTKPGLRLVQMEWHNLSDERRILPSRQNDSKVKEGRALFFLPSWMSPRIFTPIFILLFLRTALWVHDLFPVWRYQFSSPPDQLHHLWLWPQKEREGSRRHSRRKQMKTDVRKDRYHYYMFSGWEGENKEFQKKAIWLGYSRLATWAWNVLRQWSFFSSIKKRRRSIHTNTWSSLNQQEKQTLNCVWHTVRALGRPQPPLSLLFSTELERSFSLCLHLWYLSVSATLLFSSS